MLLLQLLIVPDVLLSIMTLNIFKLDQNYILRVLLHPIVLSMNS